MKKILTLATLLLFIGNTTAQVVTLSQNGKAVGTVGNPINGHEVLTINAFVTGADPMAWIFQNKNDPPSIECTLYNAAGSKLTSSFIAAGNTSNTSGISLSLDGGSPWNGGANGTSTFEISDFNFIPSLTDALKTNATQVSFIFSTSNYWNFQESPLFPISFESAPSAKLVLKNIPEEGGQVINKTYVYRLLYNDVDNINLTIPIEEGGEEIASASSITVSYKGNILNDTQTSYNPTSQNLSIQLSPNTIFGTGKVMNFNKLTTNQREQILTVTIDNEFEFQILLVFISPKAVWINPSEQSTDIAYTENEISVPGNWQNDKRWAIYATDANGDPLYINGYLQVYNNLGVAENFNPSNFATAGIPILGTDVLIQANTANHPNLDNADSFEENNWSYLGENTNGFYYGAYAEPDLNQKAMGKGFTLKPTCSTITFEMEASLGRQDKLEYYEANIEFNFGNYEDSSLANSRKESDYLQRERFYLLSAPLKEMYSGDFFFGGKPNVYMRHAKLQDVPEGGYPGDEWHQDSNLAHLTLTNNISAYRIELGTGVGFAYFINGNNKSNSQITGNPTLSDAVFNQTNISKKNGVVKYPRFLHENYGPQASKAPEGESKEDYGFNQYEHWDGAITHWRYFYAGYPDWMGTLYENVTRTYQAINIQGQIQNVYRSFRLQEEASVSIPELEGNSTHVLIGNPFMSNIDFLKFQETNKNSIEGSYYLYDGTNVISHLISNGVVVSSEETPSTSVRYIAPMQGFFVKPITGAQQIKFQYSDTTPKSNSITPNLRNIRQEPEILRVTVVNEKENRSTAVIVRSADEIGNGADLLASDNKAVPAIYFSQNGDTKSIMEIDLESISIPIGIIDQTLSRNLSLRFNGVSSFASHVKISLYDDLSGESTPIEEGFTYHFNVENNSESNPLANRFFIVFSVSENLPTNFDEPDTKYSFIELIDKQLCISSSPTDLIEDVKIHSTEGQTVFSERAIHKASYQRNLNLSPGIYIVTAKTQTDKFIQKIIVK